MKSTFRTVLLGLLVVALPACTSTVVPTKVPAKEASFDQSYKPDAKQGEQEPNSGFIQFNDDGSGLITPHARDRYNELVKVYGNRFLPPLSIDSGITPEGGVFRIDPDHLVKFATMNRWRREGK